MNWLLVAGVLVVLGLMKWSVRGDFKNLDAAEAVLYIKEKAPCIIDVRTTGEQAGGVIQGALCVPLSDLESRIQEVPPDRPLLVYCASGMRSLRAASAFSRAGRPEVANLSGGIGAWLRAGFPLSSRTGAQ